MGRLGPAAQAQAGKSFQVCVHTSHIHSTQHRPDAKLPIPRSSARTPRPRGPPRTARHSARPDRRRRGYRHPDHSFARGAGGSPGPPPVRVSCSALSAVVGDSKASASESLSSAHSRLHSSGVMATWRRCARKPVSPAQGTHPASMRALGSSGSGGVSVAGAPRAAAMARCSGMGTSS